MYGATQMAVGALCSFVATLGADPVTGAALTVSGASLLGIVGAAIAAVGRRRTEAILAS